MRARVEFTAALALDALGAGAALLISTRYWQTVVTPRARPFSDDVLPLSGRTIDAAPTAFALVALAGVVAVLATRGVVRRALGGLIGLAGAGLVWRSVTALSAVSTSRARDLVRLKHQRVSMSNSVVPHVATHLAWGACSVACGVLVVVGGLLIALRGGRWAVLSARYEPPPAEHDTEDARAARQKADAALWGALDRGEDPTTRDPRDIE